MRHAAAAFSHIVRQPTPPEPPMPDDELPPLTARWPRMGPHGPAGVSAELRAAPSRTATSRSAAAR
jgi:hypothetical protein